MEQMININVMGLVEVYLLWMGGKYSYNSFVLNSQRESLHCVCGAKHSGYFGSTALAERFFWSLICDSGTEKIVKIRDWTQYYVSAVICE